MVLLPSTCCLTWQHWLPRTTTNHLSKVLRPAHLPHTALNRSFRALSVSKDQKQNNPSSTQTMAAPYNTNSHKAMVKIQTYNPGGEACLLTLTAFVNAARRAYPVLIPAAAQGHRQYFLSYLLQVTRPHGVCSTLPTTGDQTTWCVPSITYYSWPGHKLCCLPRRTYYRWPGLVVVPSVSPFLQQVSRPLHCVQSYCRCPDH